MKLKPYTTEHGNGAKETGWMFWCPGCNDRHWFRIDHGGAPVRADGTPLPVWSFDGNMDAPTFAPSLLYHTETGDWVDGKWVGTGRVTLCHLHLRAGMLEFLADCPHPLRDQVVPLPELPEPH